MVRSNCDITQLFKYIKLHNYCNKSVVVFILFKPFEYTDQIIRRSIHVCRYVYT